MQFLVEFKWSAGYNPRQACCKVRTAFNSNKGRVPFNKNSMSRAQWNGTSRLHTPDPSHRAFGYCSCKQDTKELYWGQQFCQMERAILPWVSEAFHARFPVSETTHETKVPIVGEKEPLVPSLGPFRSDRPNVCTNRSLQNFGLNGKRLRCPFTTRTILAKKP